MLATCYPRAGECGSETREYMRIRGARLGPEADQEFDYIVRTIELIDCMCACLMTFWFCGHVAYACMITMQRIYLCHTYKGEEPGG